MKIEGVALIYVCFDLALIDDCYALCLPLSGKLITVLTHPLTIDPMVMAMIEQITQNSLILRSDDDDHRTHKGHPYH